MAGFWRKWLMVAAGVTVSAGLGFAALTVVGATGTHDAIFELVYLPGELDAPAGEVASFAIGVAGAVMAGWGTMMLILLRSHQTDVVPSTWWALTGSLLAWFVVDGAVSVAAGAMGNVALNVAFLVLFGPALVATRPGRAGRVDHRKVS